MTRIDLGVTALVSLIPISILAGIGMLLVFRHASDQAAVRRAKSLAQAHLLEFRLFLDEPGLILRAQRDLIVANLRFMKLMLWPVLWLAVPMALLLGVLEGWYGHAPLPVGRSAIVTAQLNDAEVPLALKVSGEVAVETPPVHVPAERQVSWRIKPLEATSAGLEFVRDGREFRKSLSAGAGMHFISERRGSLASFLLNPCELPLSDREIGWIAVHYPSASILGFHWLIWFFAISAITALALRRRFRTAF
jgi:hypothetical protein